MISNYCKHLTIYCPYLIVNLAPERLIYQEKDFKSKIISHEPSEDYRLKKKRDKRRKTLAELEYNKNRVMDPIRN